MLLLTLASTAWRASLRSLYLLTRCLLACLLASNVTAESAGAPEYQIKAAMVFKFLSYTQWPDSAFEAADSPYRVWILGSSPISNELGSMVAGRQVNARPLRLYKAATEEDISRPHVVFVSRDAERYLPALGRDVRDKPVLIVTESDKGLEGSSSINLRLVGDRIGFDVALGQTEKSKLKLSSRLLSVASSVEREKP